MKKPYYPVVRFRRAPNKLKGNDHFVKTSLLPQSDFWRRDCREFFSIFAYHVRRRGDTPETLSVLASASGFPMLSRSISQWLSREHAPRSDDAFNFLEVLCDRYGLPRGFFRRALLGASRPAHFFNLTKRNRSLVQWHLPLHFNSKSRSEQQDIVRWIEQNILPGATEYGRYVQQATRRAIRMRFPLIEGNFDNARSKAINVQRLTSRDAPATLAKEVSDFVAFKTSLMTPFGQARNGRWQAATAKFRVEQLGMIFGACSAVKGGELNGLGVAPSQLSMALLVLPQLWDWYLRWRQSRRGFFTQSEANMLNDLRSMSRPETGWLSQNPELANRLQPIEGLICLEQVQAIQNNWTMACVQAHEYSK